MQIFFFELILLFADRTAGRCLIHVPYSMLTRSIEGKVKELYTFGRQHVRLWSRALGTAERGATPTGIVLEPATKDR